MRSLLKVEELLMFLLGVYFFSLLDYSWWWFFGLILTPDIGMLGYLMGNVDFSTLAIILKEKTAEAEAVTIKYGLFINTLIDFIIIAFAIFMVVNQMNKLKKVEPPADPTTKPCPKCFTDIPIKATRCPNCTAEI